MRIVMLSCNTGEGHNSTAKAIVDVLKQRGVECEILDVLSFLSPSFSKIFCNWHARLYKYAPKLWDVGYRVTEAKEGRSDESAVLYELMTFGASNLRVKLESGYLTAYNNTGNDLKSVYVYYKKQFSSGGSYLNGIYLGGITYRVLLGDVKNGETAQAIAGHCTPYGCEVVRIEWAS